MILFLYLIIPCERPAGNEKHGMNTDQAPPENLAD
jgi:hypothetical protein